MRYVKDLTKGIEKEMPEVVMLKLDHDVDHVHSVLSIPPKLGVSDVVRRLKSTSGRLLKKKFEYLCKTYWGVDGIGSDGCFLSTVGVDERAIERYIQRQGQGR